jgi:hypothetical protein
MSLENADQLELENRVQYLITQYVDVSLDLAKRLEEFGRMRKEIQLIMTELKRRGVEVKLDDGWVKEVVDQEERLRTATSASS